MGMRAKKCLSMYLWITFMFVAAIYLEHITFRNSLLEFMVSIISGIIYICVFAFWMLSVKWRCMHQRIRRYIMAIGALLVFLMGLTILQENFAVLPIIKRQLWYSYSIPIVFVPQMGLCAASCVAQPESQPVAKKYRILSIPSVVICLLVLTNELHDLAFNVQKFEVFDTVTKYGILSWILIAWAAFLELYAIITLILKSRTTWKMVALPLLFFFMAETYMVLFLSGVPVETAVIMPVGYSILHFAICESCLFLRLFPTNFYYRQYFENADIGIQLTDNGDVVSIRSNKARALSEEEIQLLKAHGTLLKNGFEIYREKVQGGYFVYEKDLRSIQQNIEKLQMVTSELEETTNYIEEEQRINIRKTRLEEKERIFNEISRVVTPDLDKISRLLKEIPTLNEEDQRRMMWRVNLVGTYIKRRANLELRRKESPAIFGSELSQCMAEYAISLNGAGITSISFIEPGTIISPDSAILLLDIYTNLIDEHFHDLKNMSVIQSREGTKARFLIEALSRRPIEISEEKTAQYSAFAAEHSMNVFFEADKSSTMASYTIIMADGGNDE